MYKVTIEEKSRALKAMIKEVCGLVMEKENVIAKINELWELVWGEDIPSPCCPEYKEHHESIQKILKFIETELLEMGDE